jgi:hypothetical protein
MFWQIQQSLLVDLLPLAAINVAIPPRRQRSDSTSPAAIQIQFAVRAFPPLRITAFKRKALHWLAFVVQKLAYSTCRNSLARFVRADFITCRERFDCIWPLLCCCGPKSGRKNDSGAICVRE